MSRAAIVLAAAAMLCTGVHAAEFNAVQADKSRVTFVSKQMNVPIDGKFGKFSAQISFDPAKPEAGRAQIEIDLTSIDAGSDDANTEVKRKAWFDTQNFPTAKFVAGSVRALGGARFEARPGSSEVRRYLELPEDLPWFRRGP